jgi:hypothetical protein
MKSRRTLSWPQLGLRQIQRELERLERLLGREDLPLLDRVFWQGRRRELRAAAWLLHQVGDAPANSAPALEDNLDPEAALAVLTPAASALVATPSSTWERLLALRPLSQRPLENCTDRPMELDLLHPQQRWRLLQAVVEQFQDTMAAAQGIDGARLPELGETLLVDLWLGSARRFFGPYYGLMVSGQEQSVMEVLTAQRSTLWDTMLQPIPLWPELLGYLLGGRDISISNRLQTHGSIPAEDYAGDLLANTLVQVANAVLAPFINTFGELEAVKQQFYTPQLLATRDLARFRNHLSWQYYLDRQYREPIAMFESRHRLWIVRDGGLFAKDIYAPRRQELEALRGWPWLLTIGLEFRDAVAPLARAVTTFGGNCLVYLLTEVVGRGLGLVGRGVLQGLGQALQEKR